MISCVITGAFLVSACGSVEIPDFEACGDFMDDGARCTTFISGKSRNLSPGQFDRLRYGRISLSPQDYREVKAAIEKLCAVNRCTYEQEQAVEEAKSFFKRLDGRK